MNADADVTGKARETIMRHAMLEDNARVLAAVSGGVDSMVLLHALIALGHHVHVAHFDHATRAGVSAEDAAFVQAHCASIGVPCTLGHWRDWPVSLPDSPSFEMEARARRYSFLKNVALGHGCAAIATGHHADDQAETLLMRMLRGTGPGGMAGIPPVRMEGDVRVVRPLLGCSRAELETWARARAIPWREDITNVDLSTQRNRVRHELLPMLAADYNPSVRDALTRLADSTRVEDEYLAIESAALLRIAGKGDRLSRSALEAAHEALRRRALLGWLTAHGIRPDHDAVLEMVAFVSQARTGQRLSVNADCLLHAAGDEIQLVRADASAPALQGLSVPGEAVFLGKRFVARVFDTSPTASPRAWCSETRQVFDAERLGSALVLRTRRNGDAFHPFGMRGTRKLQDYFIDRRVPRPDRDHVPILEASAGIAWVVGHAPGNGFVISEHSKRFATVEVSPCD